MSKNENSEEVFLIDINTVDGNGADIMDSLAQVETVDLGDLLESALPTATVVSDQPATSDTDGLVTVATVSLPSSSSSTMVDILFDEPLINPDIT